MKSLSHLEHLKTPTRTAQIKYHQLQVQERGRNRIQSNLLHVSSRSSTAQTKRARIWHFPSWRTWDRPPLSWLVGKPQSKGFLRLWLQSILTLRGGKKESVEEPSDAASNPQKETQQDPLVEPKPKKVADSCVRKLLLRRLKLLQRRYFIEEFVVVLLTGQYLADRCKRNQEPLHRTRKGSWLQHELLEFYSGGSGKPMNSLYNSWRPDSGRLYVKKTAVSLSKGPPRGEVSCFGCQAKWFRRWRFGPRSTRLREGRVNELTIRVLKEGPNKSAARLERRTGRKKSEKICLCVQGVRSGLVKEYFCSV